MQLLDLKTRNGNELQKLSNNDNNRWIVKRDYVRKETCFPPNEFIIMEVAIGQCAESARLAGEGEDCNTGLDMVGLKLKVHSTEQILSEAE
ncbi:hypothetical protein GWI33_005140 [Rhynchophorus ferrugineus]|uniref:Uncharacterized protein n=1 Tax=Rhynchophorus ferrugineus TaxID=354439 RepID=A0A834IU96_RHYFE|nr:hypothetical protein GWI33_005140 [Rhynchophorus ferrugineus]